MEKKLNKKGISSIVATVMLIALTVVLVGVVWTIINNLIEKETESSVCFAIFEKVSLNSEYTCYIDNGFRFSINIGDIDVDEVLVGISAEGDSSTFKISKIPSKIDNLVMYPSGSSSISLPSKNAGLTYVFDMAGAGFSEDPDSISIAPIINGMQCSVSDSMNEIGRCQA